MKRSAFRKKFPCILLFCLFIAACSTMTRAEWQILPDKNFYFEKFTWSKTYNSRNKAFAFMESTDTEKIFAAIEKAFPVTVNRDAYRSFIEKKDIKAIQEKGLLVIDTCFWQKKAPGGNVIHLFLEEDVDHGGLPFYYYDLKIISNGRVLVRFFGQTEETWKVMPQLAEEIEKAAVQ